MIDKLFDRIKELEKEIENIKNRNEIISKNLSELCKICKIPKESKENFKITLFKNLNSLCKLKNDEKFFENGILSFSAFIKLLEGKNQCVLMINLTEDELKNKFVYKYFTKHFNAFFTIKDNILIGIINPSDIKKVKTLKVIPFFNPINNEINDIILFKIVFFSNVVDFEHINAMIEKFIEFLHRPSFRNKHFVEYSMDEKRVIDFEMEEIRKVKEKYSYVFDKKYPDLEIDVKKNIDNNPFILAVLEKIDVEINEIKNSRGLMNVVNRILNYIALHTTKKDIRKIIETIRETLKK